MNSEVQAALGFNLHAPLKTIHAYLSSLNPPMLHMLDDELIEAATREIRAEGKPRKMSTPPAQTYFSGLMAGYNEISRTRKKRSRH